MKYLIICVFVLFSVLNLSAQSDEYIVTGIVKEANSAQTIDYATVVLMDKRTNEIITGATTDNGGKFKLFSNTQNVSLEVSFIGYEKVVIEDIVLLEMLLISSPYNWVKIQQL